MFEPALPVRRLLEKFVLEKSMGLLASPKRLPRPIQIFRKALLVDRLSGALSYLWWYSKAVVATRCKPCLVR